MGFVWKGFIDVARLLYQSGQQDGQIGEAAFRSAVSRSYYAAHCHSRNYALSKGAKISTSGRAHREVIDYYSKHSDARMVSIGINLLTLLERRKKADYDDTATINERSTGNSIHIASQIIQQLRII